MVGLKAGGKGIQLEMHDASRTIGFGALILALVAAGIALILSGGSEPAPTATAVRDSTPAAASRGEPAALSQQQAGRDEVLDLPARGTPLAWVRFGERVEIRSAPGGPVTETVGPETQYGSRSVFSVAKTDGEWAGVPNPFTGNGVLGWIKLDPDQLKAGYTTHAIVVDLSEHRAQLIRAGEVLRTFTVSVGAPGAETPTGSFAVTDTFRGGLNPVYGCCAVALTAVQPKLPSGWIGGDRIAIHGTTGPLGVNVSHGCVRAADRDVSALVDDVPPGAPVTIRQ